jgi:murein L,D-transpeptidase YafK
MRKTILFYFILSALMVSCAAGDTRYKNYDRYLTGILDTLNLSADKISILIDKSDYKLSVLIDTVIIKEYPVVFGKNPMDDKLRQGDGCTPEGMFQMASKYPHKEWSKFIWLNYPTEDSWRKHNKAKKEGKIPANSEIGGEIGIHGVPKSMDVLIDIRYNWTLGCISMKNRDIDELYPYISGSTKIEIRK